MAKTLFFVSNYILYFQQGPLLTDPKGVSYPVNKVDLLTTLSPLIFIGLLIHMNYVPFKRKFHNIMEYFILMVTLVVLVCGLLFFINQFPTDGFKTFIQVVAILTMVGSTVFVISMILWDANTRKKNEKKKRKRKMREIENLIQQRREKGLPFDDLIQQKRTQYDEQGNVVFKLRFFEHSSESDEDPNATLNSILENLFSMKRLKTSLRVKCS